MHYCIHRLKKLPNEIEALSLRERAFLYASIDIEVKRQKKEAERMEAAARKKGG